MDKHNLGLLLISTLVMALILIQPGNVNAHCDGMDGPVVKAARKALETRDVNSVLIWVRKKDEAEIKQAFQETLAVRRLSTEARELADRYFFETLVRIHRAGEDAPYTGLKPAGRDLGPAITAADKAIESGEVEELAGLLQDTLHHGLGAYFQTVLTNKNFSVDEVTKGRKFVGAYVRFIHYAEHVYEAAAMTAEGHYPESREAGSHN